MRKWELEGREYVPAGMECRICGEDRVHRMAFRDERLDTVCRRHAQRLRTISKPGKVCYRCQAWKPRGEFYQSRTASDGLTARCKVCDKQRSKERHTRATWDMMADLGLDISRCAYCLKPAEHVDHVRPLAKGGPDDPLNYAPACARCNQSKSDRDPREWMRSRVLAFSETLVTVLGRL